MLAIFWQPAVPYVLRQQSKTKQLHTTINPIPTLLAGLTYTGPKTHNYENVHKMVWYYSIYPSSTALTSTNLLLIYLGAQARYSR